MSETRRTRTAHRLAAAVAVVVSAGLVWSGSQAAFTAQTSNDGNSVQSGTVSLDGSDMVTAAFSMAGLAPGESQTRCLRVGYTGSLAAAVDLFAASGGGDLAPYVHLVVTEGNGGSAASCTGYTADVVTWTGTVAELVADHATPAQGLGFFAPTGPGRNRSYQITATLDPATPQTGQGDTATLDLGWQARSVTPEPVRVVGMNTYGKLGLGDTTTRSALTAWPAAYATTWEQQSLGREFSCGVKAPGTLWCWGRGSSGRLGASYGVDQRTPVQVGTDSDWASVSVGYSSACALKRDGGLWCWGNNFYGQMGRGNTDSSIFGPVKVGTDTWSQIAAGGYGFCGIRTTGTLWCVGDGSSGQLGNGGTGNATTYVQVGSASDWTQISRSGVDACGIRGQGEAFCWGGNFYGTVGVGDTALRTTPTPVSGGHRWALVEALYDATCGITVDGERWCWGSNSGNLFGSFGDRTVPTRIGTDTDWSFARLAHDGACAARTDRSLWCIGSGMNGSTATYQPVAGLSVGRLSHASEASSLSILAWPAG